MAGFAVEDMFLKAAAQTLPVWQVMVAFGGGGMAVFALLGTMRGERLFQPAAIERTMLVRNLFEVFGRLFYTLAIALTSLSATTAILQAAPIVVVAGAALFFGEKVGWRRWMAIFLGLFGVLIVLRPGAEGFTWMSILAVFGMLGFAGRDLATRAAPKGLGSNVLGVYGFLMIVIAGVIYAIYSSEPPVWPQPHTALSLFAAILFGVGGYSSLTRAMRTGDVSAVTPFRYTRLLFGVAFGVTVFGETLDAATYVGSAIIVASGLFIILRGRARA